MATKKATSAAKKSVSSKKPAAKATTKVTTVKAVESRPAETSTVEVAPAKRNLSLSHRSLIAALIAEFIGTFVLAAVVIATQGQPLALLFALAGVVLIFGTISGAYVNPALTVAAWITRRITVLRALGYIVAQVLGAMLALVVLNAFVSSAPSPDPSNPLAAAQATQDLFKASELPKAKEWIVLLAEVLGTAILGFAVANATREVKDRTAAALTVGLGIFLAVIIVGSSMQALSATSIFNPAVAVALQVNFTNIWILAVYAIGSTLGAVLGFGLYDLLRNNEKE